MSEQKQTHADAIPIILDSDLGVYIDDVLALLLAGADRRFNLGLFLSANEVEDGRRAKHAQDLARQFLLDDDRIQFVRGVKTPKLGPPTKSEAEAIVKAVQSFVETSKPKQVRFVGIGGMQNLSLLLKHDPEVVKQMDVVVMGGKFQHITNPKATYNFGICPTSTKYVLSEMSRRKWDIYLVPQDVTRHEGFQIRPGESKHMHDLSESNPQIHEFLNQNYMQHSCAVHDVVALYAMDFDPQWVRKKVWFQEGTNRVVESDQENALTVNVLDNYTDATVCVHMKYFFKQLGQQCQFKSAST